MKYFIITAVVVAMSVGAFKLYERVRDRFLNIGFYRGVRHAVTYHQRYGEHLPAEYSNEKPLLVWFKDKYDEPDDKNK